MTWTGDWDENFDDRIYGSAPISVGTVSALVTGLQHRNGATVSGVALRIPGVPAPVDLTPAQARELSYLLTALAAQAEQIDGLLLETESNHPRDRES